LCSDKINNGSISHIFNIYQRYLLLFTTQFVHFETKLLGINIFTFILAALIVFFLSLNYILGPGWLGSTIGIPGTGAFQEVSPSIPGTIDLNKPEYRL